MEAIQPDKMNKNVILIGAGAHAAEITDYVALFNDVQTESIARINVTTQRS